MKVFAFSEELSESEVRRVEKLGIDVLVCYVEAGNGFAVWRTGINEGKASYGYSFVKQGKLEQVYRPIFSAKMMKILQNENEGLWPKEASLILHYYIERKYRFVKPWKVSTISVE